MSIDVEHRLLRFVARTLHANPNSYATCCKQTTCWQVKGLAWSPFAPAALASVSDDGQLLLWDADKGCVGVGYFGTSRGWLHDGTGVGYMMAQGLAK